MTNDTYKNLLRIHFLSLTAIFILLNSIANESCAQFFQYDAKERRPNQLFISCIPSYAPEFCKRIMAVPVADIFNKRLENFFDNEGFTTQDCIKQNFGAWPIPPSRLKKMMDRRENAVPQPDDAIPKRGGLPTISPLVLPEVMQDTRQQIPRMQPMNIFRPNPYLFPPHMLPPEATETIAENDPTTSEAMESAADSLKDLPVLPYPIYTIQDASPEQKVAVKQSIPVLQLPISEIAEATPTVPIYPKQQMMPQRPLFPVPSRQPILTEEQRIFQRGLDAFRFRNYIKARQTFSELTKLNPDSAHAQFGYGLSLFYAGEYEEALQILGNSYRIAKQNGVPEPTVWDLKIDPRDFRYHHKKLTRYVNENPQNKATGTLLFLLTHAGVMPKSTRNR